MRLLVLEVFAATALTIAAIIASATGVKASDVMVINAFARASASPVAKSGAAYFTVMNHAAEPDRLLAVSTPAARSAELHRTVTEGEVVKMEPVETLDIPANATVEMKPGGLHVMLMGLTAPLKEGDTLTFDLAFARAGHVSINVPVGGVAAGEPDHTGAESD